MGQLSSTGGTADLAVMGGAAALAARRSLAAAQADGQEARLMAFAWLGLLAFLILALLWLMKLRGPLLTLAAAAVAFGCAGYATQGRPDLTGSPRSATDREPPMPL